jgi:cobalt-zinc-cadmium efflux system protein
VGHDHHHHHHHHPHPGPAGGDPRRALGIALGLNGAFLVVEAAVGWWAGSLALLSDAAHMLSDVGALVLALAAAQLARRGVTAAMTFGLGRAEVLGAFVNGLGLLVACGWIVWEAGHRLASGPPEVAGLPVLVVGAIGLAINLGSAWALWRSDPDNINIRAALAHMLADALGSLAAVVAAVLLMLGVQAADAAVSLGVAALVAWGAWSVLRDAGRILLQLPPADLDVARIRDALVALDGVLQVHDVHAWSLDGRHAIVSAHLVLADGAAYAEVCHAGHAVLEERFDIHHATLQTEAGAGCPVDCGVARLAQ